MGRTLEVIKQLPELSEDEITLLVARFVEGSSPEGVTREEIADFIRWCTDQLYGAALVGLLLTGRFVAAWSETENDYGFSIPK